MNTQVNSEAPAGTAETAVQVAVAETAPVALTPVAAAIAPTTAAAPAPVAATPRKSVLDDFLDEDDAVEAAANAEPADQADDPFVDGEDGAASEEEGTLDGLEDEGNGEDGANAEGEDGTLEGLEGNSNADLDALGDLDEVAGEEEEEQSMVVIDVYKKKCTDCTHLVPWGTKTHKRCHFSNGNELCPAQSVRIRRYIPVDQIVSRFMAAESQGDTDRLVTLYANLKLKAADVQEEIHAALKAAREKKAQRAVEA